MSIQNKRILHYISKVGTFMFLYGVIYMLLKLVISWMPFIKSDSLIYVPILSVLTIFIIKKYIKIYSPYNRH
ncbi:hypothetical protein KAI37_02899 [Paenibacillus sp. S25]|nr:hypothetical protein KAI37_02899 [Paenibacillus sp. S25]